MLRSARSAPFWKGTTAKIISTGAKATTGASKWTILSAVSRDDVLFQQHLDGVRHGLQQAERPGAVGAEAGLHAAHGAALDVDERRCTMIRTKAMRMTPKKTRCHQKLPGQSGGMAACTTTDCR